MGTAPKASRRSRSRALAIVVSAGSAAAFVWMHIGASMPAQQFSGVCERLLEAGLRIVPQDVMCVPSPWTARAAYIAASLLVAVGFVLPGAILAVSGYRVMALLPVSLALAIRYPQDVLFPAGSWANLTWPGGLKASTAATIALLAAPVAVIAYLDRANRRSHEQPSLIAGIAATVVCGTGVAGVVFVTSGMLSSHIGATGRAVDIEGIVPEAIAIALFGVLLGPDRRWWPWSFAPIALLMSAGPADALVVGPQHLVNWYQFGIVVPLFLAGLIGSGWRPFGTRLARFFPGRGVAPEVTSVPPSPVPRAPGSPRRVRGIVVLNALGAAVLVVSLIVFRSDPLPMELSSPIPSYLGMARSVEDLRARLDLERAMVAMDDYRASHGTYAGFDAAQGTVGAPVVSWSDGSPEPEDGRSYRAPVGIISTADQRVRLVALSASGSAFCLQRTDAGLSYGEGVRTAGDGHGDVLRRAVANCGSIPWSAAALRRLPVETMCLGFDPNQFLMCRLMQAFAIQTLKGTTAAV